ncbi:hypothetical protein ElyMa_005209700 [Elysia marginata]|uniref:Uncharacterized protein n=1 Tax=Elysia marginata TaxID=1093978 RepID=A0AAV4JU63_9GAST|nr:hypothetical protein ElyMa_005209700 [Elysia marginata]
MRRRDPTADQHVANVFRSSVHNKRRLIKNLTSIGVSLKNTEIVEDNLTSDQIMRVVGHDEFSACEDCSGLGIRASVLLILDTGVPYYTRHLVPPKDSHTTRRNRAFSNTAPESQCHLDFYR